MFGFHHFEVKHAGRMAAEPPLVVPDVLLAVDTSSLKGAPIIGDHSET